MPRKDKQPKQPKAMKGKSKPKAKPKRMPKQPRQALEATVTESVQRPMPIRKVAMKKPKELRPELEPAWYSEGLHFLHRGAVHPQWAEHYAAVLGHAVWQALRDKCPPEGLHINVASYTNAVCTHNLMAPIDSSSGLQHDLGVPTDLPGTSQETWELPSRPGSRHS